MRTGTFSRPTAGTSIRATLVVAGGALVASCVRPAMVGERGRDARKRSPNALATLSPGDARARLQQVLAAFASSGRIPGAVLAAYAGSGGAAPVVVAVGVADLERRVPMRPADRMLAGSVGKTFFAALALQLVGEGRIGLDTALGVYLREQPWAARLPNADRITVRMLLDHTSGYGPYDDRFLSALAREPLRERTRLELLEPLFEHPAAEPGARFAYSDLNYIVLATVLEAVTGTHAYDEIHRRFVRPLGLAHTAPAERPDIPGLVPGYAGAENPFGGNRMMRRGRLILNPQFEWAGGGFVSNAGDLARWIAAFCRGVAFPKRLWPQVAAGVDAPELGRGSRYGLGIVIDSSGLGRTFGHGGFFPGYVTWVRWYQDLDLAVAIQVNTSDDARFGSPAKAVLDTAARALANP